MVREPNETSDEVQRDLHQQATLAFEQEDYERALDLWTQALAADSASKDSHATRKKKILGSMVECRLKVGAAEQLQAALDDAHELLQMDSDDPNCRILLASVFLKMEHGSDKACKALEAALKLDPTNQTANTMLLREVRKRRAGPRPTVPSDSTVEQASSIQEPPRTSLYMFCQYLETLEHRFYRREFWSLLLPGLFLHVAAMLNFTLPFLMVVLQFCYKRGYMDISLWDRCSQLLTAVQTFDVNVLFPASVAFYASYCVWKTLLSLYVIALVHRITSWLPSWSLLPCHILLYLILLVLVYFYVMMGHVEREARDPASFTVIV